MQNMISELKEAESNPEKDMIFKCEEEIKEERRQMEMSLKDN